MMFVMTSDEIDCDKNDHIGDNNDDNEGAELNISEYQSMSQKKVTSVVPLKLGSYAYTTRVLLRNIHLSLGFSRIDIYIDEAHLT